MKWPFSRAPRAAAGAVVLPIGPGDDLVVGIDAAAGEDAIGLLHALQAQFPSVRVHLLVGFGRTVVEVQRNANGGSGADNGRHQPRPSLAQLAARAVAVGAQPAEGGHVALITHLAGGRVIAVSVPPEQVGDAVAELHAVHSAGAPAIPEKAEG